MFAKHQPKNGGRNYRLVTKPNRRKVLAKWTRHKKSVEYKDVDDFGKVSPSASRNVLQIQIIPIPQKPAPEIDEEKLAAARSYVRGTGLQITPVWRTFLWNIFFQEHVPIPIIAKHSISSLKSLQYLDDRPRYQKFYCFNIKVMAPAHDPKKFGRGKRTPQ